MKESETEPRKVLQQTITTAIDLGAYLKKIGYEGDRAPALNTLRTIQLR